jgi:hypothetical protein
MCSTPSTWALGLALAGQEPPLVGQEPPLGSQSALVGLEGSAGLILAWVGLEPLSELVPD